jgi:hypothetical protein
MSTTYLCYKGVWEPSLLNTNGSGTSRLRRASPATGQASLAGFSTWLSVLSARADASCAKTFRAPNGSMNIDFSGALGMQSTHARSDGSLLRLKAGLRRLLADDVYTPMKSASQNDVRHACLTGPVTRISARNSIRLITSQERMTTLRRAGTVVRESGLSVASIPQRISRSFSIGRKASAHFASSLLAKPSRISTIMCQLLLVARTASPISGCSMLVATCKRGPSTPPTSGEVLVSSVGKGTN